MMESLPVEIRRMIMDYSSNSELLRICCVSKLFNYEASTVLRDRVNLMPVLNCGNLEDFLLDHNRSRSGINFLVPFSGIKICWSHPNHRDACPPRNQRRLDPFTLEVLDRMPLKRLSVQFSGGQHLPKTCMLFQFVNRIFQEHLGDLEELELSERPQLFQFILDIIPGCTFPRLKILKLFRWPGRRVSDRCINSFIKFTSSREDLIRKIKARAPNLREVQEFEVD